MILTTQEVAAELGVTPGRVRQLVVEGSLQPLRRGVRPLRFRLDVVIDYARQAMTQAERDTLERISEQWRDVVRDVC